MQYVYIIHKCLVHIFQKDKINRQQEYARQIKEKNRMALESSRRKAPPPGPKEDPEKESLLDRRKMVRIVAIKNLLTILFSVY